MLFIFNFMMPELNFKNYLNQMDQWNFLKLKFHFMKTVNVKVLPLNAKVYNVFFRLGK